MKRLIYFGVAVGGTLGSWLGSLLDNGDFLGIWGIVLGAVGSFIGVWAGYKIGKDI